MATLLEPLSQSGNSTNSTTSQTSSNQSTPDSGLNKKRKKASPGTFYQTVVSLSKYLQLCVYAQCCVYCCKYESSNMYQALVAHVKVQQQLFNLTTNLNILV